MTIRRRRLWIGTILGLGLLIRLGYAVFGTPLESNVFSDMGGYVQTAELINDQIWQPHHFLQPIGFPLILHLVKARIFEWGMALSLAHALLSFASLVLMWRLTEEWFGFKAGIVALALGSIHLPWIYLTNYALPETAFTFLLSAGAWVAGRIVKSGPTPRKLSFLWGILFAGALWLKGTHIFLLPLFACGLLVLHRRKSATAIAALAVSVGAGLALHGVLTYSKIGVVRLTATGGGLNFLEGKCPEKRNFDSLGYSALSPLYYQLDLVAEKRWGRPFTDAGYFWRQGLKCIAKDPFVLVQSFESIPYLFLGNTIWPLNVRPESGKIRLYELFFTAFLLCGLTIRLHDGLRAYSLAEFLVWGVPIVSLFACAYVFKSEARYRVPFDFWLIPLATVGWISLFERATIQEESSTR